MSDLENGLLVLERVLDQELLVNSTVGKRPLNGWPGRQVSLLYDRLTDIILKHGGVYWMERLYWNEDIETMQPAALRRLENEYLRTQLDYIWASSPFYQTRFAETGLKREDIRDLADLPLLS